MDLQNANFEVEFRCHFDTVDDAYKKLPFLSSCLQRQTVWVTSFYGLELFQSGYVLRVSDVFIGSEKRYYLGWKGRDIGEFTNIRQELSEEVTGGIDNSLIMKWLGVTKASYTPQDITLELVRSGYHRFMSFQGNSIDGYYEPLDIQAKLMSCPVLEWPLLVEIEKIAKTEEEAKEYDRYLKELCQRLKLQEYLEKEEPPSLLYAQVFSHKTNSD